MLIQDIVSGELDSNERKLDIVETDIPKKDKLNQIYTYYEKKRKYQIQFFKNVIFMMLFLVIIATFFHAKIISEKLFIIFMGIGIALIVI